MQEACDSACPDIYVVGYVLPMNIMTYAEKSHPVWVLASLFDAHKRLTEAIRCRIMPGEDVTVPEADALIILFLAKELHWPEFRGDDKGFVSFKDLAELAVHGDAQLSRRMGSLTERGLVAVKATGRGPGSSRRYRLTTQGAGIAARIWAKYCTLAETILRELPAEQLKLHRSISEHIEAAAQRLAKSEEAEIDWSTPHDDHDAAEVADLVAKLFPSGPVLGTLQSLGFSNVVVEGWVDKPVTIRMTLEPNGQRTDFELQLAIRVSMLEAGHRVTELTLIVDREAQTVTATVQHQKN